MKQYHHLQMRFPEDSIMEGRELTHQKIRYTLGQPIPETLGGSGVPIGVILTGYTRQFRLLRDGHPAGAAWFYFYRAFEGKRWAVLDELELFNDDARAA